jgi:phage terminase small subunit
MTTPDERELSAKQRRFVQEYVIDLCATRAASRAGYSRDTAVAIGHENLTKPEIRTAIDEAMKDRSQRTGIAADRVYRELAAVAFSDIRDIDFDVDGKLDAVVPEAARAVAGYTVERTDTRDRPRIRNALKLHDKLKALGMLMRHLGLKSAELPPLEVLFARLPPKVAAILRSMLSDPVQENPGIPDMSRPEYTDGEPSAQSASAPTVQPATRHATWRPRIGLAPTKPQSDVYSMAGNEGVPTDRDSGTDRCRPSTDHR